MADSHKKVRKKGTAGLEQKNNLINENTPFHIKEAYKAIRTNIIFSLSDVGCKKIAITSALSSEGKSTTCINLAITFAETGVRVLIVDCDLRRPSIAKRMGKKSNLGLTNVLVNLNSIDDVINKTDYKNLDVIFAGDITPNPAELLGSEKMRETVDILSEKYDYIFFDTSPVNLVTDAVVISNLMSGMVVVALQSSTKKDVFAHAVKQLEFANAKILGFLLNGAETISGSKAYAYRRNNWRGKA